MNEDLTDYEPLEEKRIKNEDFDAKLTIYKISYNLTLFFEMLFTICFISFIAYYSFIIGRYNSLINISNTEQILFILLFTFTIVFVILFDASITDIKLKKSKLEIE